MTSASREPASTWSSESDRPNPQKAQVPISASSKPEKPPVGQEKAKKLSPREQAENAMDVLRVTQVTQKRGILSTRHEEQQKIMNFRFNKIYPKSTTQKQLFKDSCLGLVCDIFNGKNAFVMAYGCTGSGKTHTLVGSAGQEGLIPQSLEAIFKEVGKSVYTECELLPDKAREFSAAITYRKEAVLEAKRIMLQNEKYEQEMRIETEPSKTGYVYGIFISMFEIYQENVLDLLNQSGSFGQPAQKPAAIFEDTAGNPYVRGLTWIPIHTVAEARAVISAGKRARHIAATGSNQQSSRSHTLMNIRLAKIPYSQAEKSADIFNREGIVSSQLTFVDLAGAERSDKAHVQGISNDRLYESGKIHTSLLSLGRVLQILRDNSNTIRDYNKMSMASVDSHTSTASHGVPMHKLKIVPFRESKLTRLMQKFFVTKAKCLMVVNLSLTSEFFEETQQVLKFSSVAQQVEFSNTKKLSKDSTTDSSVLTDPNKENTTYISRNSSMAGVKPPVKRKPLTSQNSKRLKSEQGKAVPMSSLSASEVDKMKSYIAELEERNKNWHLRESEIRRETREIAQQHSDIRVRGLTQYFHDVIQQREDEMLENRESLRKAVKEKVKEYKNTISEQEDRLDEATALTNQLLGEKGVLQEQLETQQREVASIKAAEKTKPVVVKRDSQSPLLQRSAAKSPMPPPPNAAYSQMRRNIDALKGSEAQARARVHELETDLRVKDLELKRDKLKIAELERNRESIADAAALQLQRLDQEKAQEIDELRTRLDGALRDLESQFEQVSDYIEIKESLTKKLNELKDVQVCVQNLENAVAEKTQQIQLLQQQNNELRAQGKSSSLETKIQHLTSAKAQVSMFLDQKTRECDQLQGQLRACVAENQQLKAASPTKSLKSRHAPKVPDSQKPVPPQRVDSRETRTLQRIKEEPPRAVSPAPKSETLGRTTRAKQGLFSRLTSPKTTRKEDSKPSTPIKTRLRLRQKK